MGEIQLTALSIMIVFADTVVVIDLQSVSEEIYGMHTHTVIKEYAESKYKCKAVHSTHWGSQYKLPP